MIGQNMFRTKLKQAYYYPQRQVAMNRIPNNVVHWQTSTGEARIHQSLAHQRYNQTQQAQYEQSLRNQAYAAQAQAQAQEQARARNTKRVTWKDVHNAQVEKIGNSLYTKPKATGCGCGGR